MAKLKLNGLYPAMIAPFNAQGELDLDGLSKTVQFLKNEGCSGVVCNGSTGEAANLTGEERATVVKVTREAAGKDFTIIAGTGTPTTRETAKLSKEAAAAGADAVLVITPFNIIPNKEGLYRHYAALAELGIPLIMYNLPAHTGVAIDFLTIERLLKKYPNVVGMKESSGDLTYFAEIFLRFGKEFTLITGADTLYFQTTLMGSPAAILALGNIAPKMIIEIIDLAKKGDVEKAKTIYYKLLPIAKAISDSVNFPAPVKEAVKQLGRPAGDPRLPTLPVDEGESQSIRQALRHAGLL